MGSLSEFVPDSALIERIAEGPLLAEDIEGKDPELIEKGPGCYRDDGYICGVALGSEAGEVYLSLRHPDTPAEAREINENTLKRINASNVPKLGANFMYDVEWLQHEGYEVNGELHDVQFAAPLLDEYRYSYSLESLAAAHGVGAKRTDILQDYCNAMGWKGNPKSHIWRMPTHVVATYAKEDARLPLDIFAQQKVALEAQGLWNVYRLECDLIPLLVQMRKQGVRLDMPLLKRTVQEVSEAHYVAQQRVYEWAGHEFNINSSPQLAKVLDSKGIHYPRNPPTEKMRAAGKPGSPNLDKVALPIIGRQYPEMQYILNFRHFDTLVSMFLVPYLNLQVNGRLHCSFHPLRSDDYGTVSGRFSATRPNLQQVSAIDEDSGDDVADEDNSSSMKGKIIRKLFIPEDGCDWAKLDYSQVEYRVTAHYASGPGSEELRYSYNNDPDIDYHQFIMDLTGFDRRTCKRLNFGGAYGMGVATAAKMFGWTMDDAALFMDNFHRAAPYIKATRKLVSRKAERTGYIFTLEGRRARVHPSRALHSMFNRLIQGSAADIMKRGMLDAWKAGVFEVVLPHLTVHDEMDVSVPKTPAGKEALQTLHEAMENVMHERLSVPLRVDCHTSANWALSD